MAWVFSPYMLILLISVGITVPVAVVAWRRRDMRGAPELVVFLVGSALWALADFAMLGFTEVEPFYLAVKLSWVGGMAVPLAALAFILRYTGRDRLYRRVRPALVGLYVVTIAVMVTNPWHELLYANPEMNRLDTTGPLPVLEDQWGPYYYFATTVGTAGVIGGLMVLFIELVRAHRLYRKQYALVIVGMVAPLVSFLTWAKGVVLVRGLDLTPFAFAITGLTFATALFSYRLLDLTPIARHTLVEEMRDGVIVVDNDDRIVDLNPAIEGAIDELRAATVGQPIERVWPAYRRLVDEDVETITVDGDGNTRYFDVQVNPLGTDSDEPRGEAGRLVLLRDVTERHLLRERYQTLIAESSDYIMIIDRDATIRYLSPSIERILGYDPEHAVGTAIFEHAHAEDRDRVRAAFERLVDANSSRQQVEFRVRNADGEWRVVEARGRNLLDNPVVEGVVAYCRDVTEREQRERRLRRQNERLENFASIVSHDLRNPLTVARGYVDVMRETEDRSYLDDIEQAHERMEELIDELLELARQGEVVSDTEPVVVGAVAREAWEHVDGPRATLSVDADVTVEADESRLRELFENLFRNAVEHGGEDVSITVGTFEDGFHVADDGPGIPPSRRGEVFDTGFTTAADGTGFGLSIVEEIVEAHDWAISVTDGREGGARFEVTVPSAGRDLVADTPFLEEE